MNRMQMVARLLCAIAASVIVFLAIPIAAAEDSTSEGTATAIPAGMAPVTDESYRIKQEDVIQFSVWGEPELRNLQLLVTPDGSINVPLLGSVKAEGYTISELKESIKQRFESEGIFVNPSLQIAILTVNRPRARVLGEVNRPGEFEFKEGDRILDAIAQAGSYKDNAWLERASLMRKGSEQPIELDLKKLLDGDLTQNYELQKGDTIYIPPENYANKVYVLGYVLRPGIYSLKDKTTVLDAISLAGGPNERGALRGTVIVRGDPTNPTRVPVDMTRLFDKGDLTQNIVLLPGDVVMVPETNRPDWNKVSSVISTVMNLTYLRRYGLF